MTDFSELTDVEVDALLARIERRKRDLFEHEYNSAERRKSRAEWFASLGLPADATPQEALAASRAKRAQSWSHWNKLAGAAVQS